MKNNILNIIDNKKYTSFDFNQSLYIFNPTIYKTIKNALTLIYSKIYNNSILFLFEYKNVNIFYPFAYEYEQLLDIIFIIKTKIYIKNGEENGIHNYKFIKNKI